MWVFTEDGCFYSAVVDKAGDKKNDFVVRTRDKRSAEMLAEFVSGEVVEWAGTDYAFRVYVSREDWADFMSEKVSRIRATNFKSEVSRAVGYRNTFMDALHDVWQVMWDYQGRVSGSVR